MYTCLYRFTSIYVNTESGGAGGELEDEPPHFLLTSSETEGSCLPHFRCILFLALSFVNFTCPVITLARNLISASLYHSFTKHLGMAT